MPKSVQFLLIGLAILLPGVSTAETGAILQLQIETTPSPSQTPLSLLSQLRFWMTSKASITKPAIGTKLTVSATGYAPSPYQTDSTPCITSAGTTVRDGVVATNFLPLGTIISINDKLYIVEDRMNSRYGSGKLDIWFSSTKETLEFGRQRLQIEVVAYGVPGQDLTVETGTEKSTDIMAEPGLIKRVSLRFVAFTRQMGSFLRAAVSPNVNRHDVNCFDEAD